MKRKKSYLQPFETAGSIDMDSREEAKSNTSNSDESQ